MGDSFLFCSSEYNHAKKRRINVSKLILYFLSFHVNRNEISRFHMDHIPLRTKLYMSLGGRYMLIGMGIGTAAAVVQWVYDSQFDHHGGHHGDHHGNHHGEH